MNFLSSKGSFRLLILVNSNLIRPATSINNYIHLRTQHWWNRFYYFGCPRFTSLSYVTRRLIRSLQPHPAFQVRGQWRGMHGPPQQSESSFRFAQPWVVKGICFVSFPFSNLFTLNCPLSFQVTPCWLNSPQRSSAWRRCVTFSMPSVALWTSMNEKVGQTPHFRASVL